MAKCKQLRGRFDDSQADSFFTRVQIGNTMPSEDLPQIMKDTWKSICKEKGLKLPDEKVMVAGLTCEKLQEEALNLIAGEVQRLQAESKLALIDDFLSRCMMIISKAAFHTDQFAHQYDKKVYREMRNDLATILTGQSLF